MEHRVSYTVIGAFVIILGGVLVAALLWLASGSVGREYTTYALYLKTGAAALGVDSAVLYHGVPVGQVSSISLDPDDPTQARVLLRIREGTPIKTDTEATVDTRGVTGSGYIELSGGSASAAPLEAEHGRQYPVIKPKPGSMVSLTSAAQKVAQRLMEVSGRLDQVLSEKNVAAISDSLASIKQLSANLAQESKTLNTELVTLDRILGHTSEATAKLPALMDQIQSTVASFHELAKRAGTAADGVDRTAQRLGQLTPEAQDLLGRLNQATQSLDSLLQSLNQEPSSIIFGKARQAGPGESGGG